jgi:uncharacterized protein (DUF2249 family)
LTQVNEQTWVCAKDAFWQQKVEIMVNEQPSGTTMHSTEIRLDVRPLLAAGQEPFGVIMNAVEQVPPGGVLVLDAPFDPAPLRNLLGGRGFTLAMEQLAEDHFRIRFQRQGVATPAAVVTDSVGAKIWRETEGVHIDVRNLTPPNPMVAVLRLIEQPDCGETVLIHHDREPVFLFPELDQRGWRWEAVPAEPPEFRYRLTRG